MVAAMQTALKDLLCEILKKYGGSLHNAALAKMVYLVDIEAVSRFGAQVTDIEWLRDNYGPFVWDILECVKENPATFSITEYEGKRLISLKDEKCSLPSEVSELVDEVVKKAPDPNKNFIAFRKYVYETPPMMLSKCNGPLEIKEAMDAAKIVDEILEDLDTPEWHEAFEYLAAN